jgi:ferrous iron transport protein B
MVELVDLPGTYSLTASNLAEQEVIRYLSSHEIDAVVNIVDASHLQQGLELTLELMDLGKPVVVGLNMMDEAARLGYKIDGPELTDILGLPVLPLVASKGQGIKALFTSVLRAAREGVPARRIPFSDPQLEQALEKIRANISPGNKNWNPLAQAIWFLQDEDGVLPDSVSSELKEIIDEERAKIIKHRGENPLWIFSSERHVLARKITQQVLERGQERITWQTRADDILLHPVWGYVFLVGILWLFFQVVYWIGTTLETPLMAFFDQLTLSLTVMGGEDNLLVGIASGALQGIAGGVAIVLPYLVPFLLGMGFLEDIGYLPRLAFMMDSLMQRMGLHGKAIVPFILGYGCNVPAVMATRTLEDRRDRFLAATLAIMVPCAARVAVIFGLIAYHLGSAAALAIYIFNILVIALTGRLLSRRILKESPGMILEVPPYRVPTLKTMFHKTWFRAKEFVIEAWPILIAGSVLLELANKFNFAAALNWIARPVTWLLGLPSAVGFPLVFGILRKELSLIMLRQSLQVADISAALSPEQMVSYTIFVVFYVPCLATLVAIRRELNTRDMLIIAVLSVIIAIVAALFARGFMVGGGLLLNLL